ncbi:MAG: hypothetical protein EOP04_28770 [Proteobacteria bacterium]|nr:MAG: hypothetical protein EOP04_28770 [Pseudomonadota bacterium]
MAGKIGRHIPDHIYRALLARSGNKCAYSGCTHPIVDERNQYVANLCHIESVAAKDQRYNPNLTEQEVNSYNNLMFMCLRHHIETNDEKAYPVVRMRQIKYAHEDNYVASPYHMDMSHVFALKFETEEYWKRVEQENAEDDHVPELKLEIDTRADYEELSQDVVATLSRLEEQIEIVRAGDEMKYWEIFNLGFPNYLTRIRLILDHMAIKYLEAFVQVHPNNMEAKARLDALREEFLRASASIRLND